MLTVVMRRSRTLTGAIAGIVVGEPVARATIVVVVILSMDIVLLRVILPRVKVIIVKRKVINNHPVQSDR